MAILYYNTFLFFMLHDGINIILIQILKNERPVSYTESIIMDLQYKYSGRNLFLCVTMLQEFEAYFNDVIFTNVTLRSFIIQTV